ncbi:hypothetical protein SRABI106_04430 [Rahnella aquatilis]|nr:hypothetical protein SRABI106_04430 [Rahnella aquatilis]
MIKAAIECGDLQRTRSHIKRHRQRRRHKIERDIQLSGEQIAGARLRPQSVFHHVAQERGSLLLAVFFRFRQFLLHMP